VVVTSIEDDPEGKEYKWADKQALGEVTAWVGFDKSFIDKHQRS
jgi:hypothetical protein